MTRQVVAITGISGVGKSTVIEKIAASISLKHLQASALIKAGRDAYSDIDMTHDQLRHLDIDENQKFLIRGFRIRSSACTGLVILDSHTVIETNDSLIRIKAHVFDAISIDCMIFLQDDPAAVVTRRRNDSARNRPVPDIDSLRVVQEEARGQAIAICQELGVPLHINRPDPTEMTELLLQLRTFSAE